MKAKYFEVDGLYYSVKYDIGYDAHYLAVCVWNGIQWEHTRALVAPVLTMFGRELNRLEILIRGWK